MTKNDVVNHLAISMAIILGIIGLIYKFDFSIMYISNSVFAVGIFLFFIGVISITGATQIFEGCKYTKRKISTKDSMKEFKTFGEYKEYKKLSTPHESNKDKAKIRLALGGVYLIISVIMSYF